MSKESLSDDHPERKRGRNGFFHLYSHYAEIYGKSSRTLKRYVDDGKKNDDPIDLDNPEQVYAWWSRNMTAKCPDEILLALVNFRKTEPAAIEAPVTKPEQIDDEAGKVEDEKPPEEIIPVTEKEKGMEALLERLEEIEVQLSRKAWLDTVSRLTVVTGKVREEQEKLGKLIPRDMAEMIIRGFHGPIEQGVRGMYSDFCNATGLAQSPANQERWNTLCDKMFERFSGEVFGEV